MDVCTILFLIFFNYPFQPSYRITKQVEIIVIYRFGMCISTSISRNNPRFCLEYFRIFSYEISETCLIIGYYHLKQSA
mgnify:CR=1 FL=1